MSSLQERLQLKRVPLDSWSIREKLSLASVVACSGDQNWMTVSRALKGLCGGDRPSDWFSQRSCAAQYGKLLENVETPKRKKRSEKDNSQTIVVETPAELILRDLRHERIDELDNLIVKEEEQYKKTKDEILEMKTKKVDMERMKEIWTQISLEQQKRTKKLFERKQWLEEREQRKMELERAWRPTPFFQNAANQSPSKPSHLNIKTEDMDIDDTNSKQGTSPLLTSLLKSPSPAPNPGTLLHTTISSPNNSRAAAPTITNLLTGSLSNIPITVQHQSFPVPMPSLTPSLHFEQSNVLQSPSQAAPTLSMLLENKFKDSQQKIPPLARIDSGTFRSQDQFQQQIDVNIVSKNLFPVNNAAENVESNAGTKDEDQQLMDVFNGLIPDNIDELADILTENNVILNPELLEEDAMLENVESLMETEPHSDVGIGKLTQEAAKIQGFSNEEPMSVDTHDGDEQLIDDEDRTTMPKDNTPTTDRLLESQQVVDLKEDDQSDFSNDAPLSELLKCNQTSSDVKQIQDDETSTMLKAETDVFESDSNDDQCLETIKREIQSLSGLKENSDNSNEETDQEKFRDERDPYDEANIFPVSETTAEDVTLTETEESKPELNIASEDNLLTESVEIVEIKEDKSEEYKQEVVIVIEENDDANSEATVSDETKVETTNVKDDEEQEANKQIKRKESTDDDDLFEDSKEVLDDIPIESKEVISDSKSIDQTITIIDTDDDSPIEVIKEDKSGKVKRDYSRKKLDSAGVEKRSDSNLPEENKSLAKVKDRDRSESPFVDDDAESKSSSRRSRSTPVIDSLPNSPASNDDHEYRTWKKSILLVYNQVYSHKYAPIFQKQIPDDKKNDYRAIVHYPMDLHTIKRNIESGKCRTTIDFQHDIALMCYNAIMYNCNDMVTRDMAVEMRDFAFSAVETIMDTWKKENEKTSSSPGVKMTRKRKNRLPAV